MNSELPNRIINFGKNTKKEGKRLYASLLKRNIMSDLLGVIITIASIAGCCILLVIGFSMKQSYVDLTRKGFHEILDFDMPAFTLDQDKENVNIGLASLLIEENTEFLPIYFFNSITLVDDTSETVQVICADPERLQAFVHLNA